MARFPRVSNNGGPFCLIFADGISAEEIVFKQLRGCQIDTERVDCIENLLLVLVRIQINAYKFGINHHNQYKGENKMENRIIIAAMFTACLALCAAAWPKTEKVWKTPAPSETAAVTTPRPTLPEPEELILPEITEKQELGMPEAESAQETTTEELPVPVPEIEDEAETEQEYVPPTQTDSIPVQPTQPEPKSAPEPKANDNELADMVYVPGFGWIESQGSNQVEYAEDMYENGNKIGTMG